MNLDLQTYVGLLQGICEATLPRATLLAGLVIGNPGEDNFELPDERLPSVLEMLEGSDEEDEDFPLFRRLGDGLTVDNLEDACVAFLRYVIGPDEDGRAMPPPIGPVPPRVRNLRQPYTITIMARRTNWFERSFHFEEFWFRRAYR